MFHRFPLEVRRYRREVETRIRKRLMHARRKDTANSRLLRKRRFHNVLSGVTLVMHRTFLTPLAAQGQKNRQVRLRNSRTNCVNLRQKPRFGAEIETRGHCVEYAPLRRSLLGARWWRGNGPTEWTWSVLADCCRCRFVCVCIYRFGAAARSAHYDEQRQTNDSIGPRIWDCRSPAAKQIRQNRRKRKDVDPYIT